MICTVKELQQLGYQIKIRHERQFSFKQLKLTVPRPFIATNGEVKFDDKNVIQSLIVNFQKKVSKLQETVLQVQEDIATYLNKDAGKKSRIEAIGRLFGRDPNFGATTVSIYFQEEFIATGQSAINLNVECNTDGTYDIFSRRYGLKNALEKALKTAHLDKKINLANLIQEIVKLRQEAESTVIV